MKWPLITILSFFIQLPAWAGLYDRDTSATRHKDIPTEKLLMNVVVGHLPTYSDDFYQKRIELLTAAINTQPYRFDLYDDVAVAHHRLKQFNEAINWIMKKNARLHIYVERKRLDEKIAHRFWFRSYSNLASHHLAQWIYAGMPHQDLKHLQQAKHWLERAINRSNKDKHPLENLELNLINALLEASASGPIDLSSIDLRFSPLLKADHKPKHAQLRPLRTALTQMIIQSNPDHPLLTMMYWNLYLTLHRRKDHGLGYLTLTHLKTNLTTTQQTETLIKNSGEISQAKKTQQLDRDYLNSLQITQKILRSRSLYLKQQLYRGRHPDRDDDFYPREYLPLAPLHILLNPSFPNWRSLMNNPNDICDC